jgi:type I restriction enzyme S subunit
VASCNDEVLAENTDDDELIQYVEISGVTAGRGITEATEIAFGNAPSRARRKVRDGDVLVSTVRTYLRAIAPVIRPPANMVASTGFAVLRSRGADPAWLGYAVQAEYFISEVIARSVGVSYPAINARDLMRIEVAVPPVETQTAIAAFLDRETGKIDALVEEQRRLIELLKEKRQAIISHAVTKGLDPNAPMKPSGIEWLGDVPAHWELVKLGWLCLKIGSGKTPRGGAETYVSDGVPFLRSQNIYDEGLVLDDLAYIEAAVDEEMAGTRVQAGDILINITGASIGRTCIVPLEVTRANVNQHVCIVRILNTPIREFVSWSLKSQLTKAQIDAAQNGAAREGLNFEQVASLRLACPPASEAHDIVEIIRRETRLLDGLADEVETTMALLQERRSVLISSAVTGKIDVWAPAEINALDIPTLVATEIVRRLSPQRTFGRVKFQKVVYLAEAEAGISEFQGKYLRAAAGPLDTALIEKLETAMVRSGDVSVEQPDGRGEAVTYRVRSGANSDGGVLSAALGARRDKLNHIITAVADLDTRGTEAVATLYAVWNDFLLDGQRKTDDEIVSGVLNDWHPEKRKKFRADELHTWLGWMRRHSLAPSGTGPHTTTGRLFP